MKRPHNPQKSPAPRPAPVAAPPPAAPRPRRYRKYLTVGVLLVAGAAAAWWRAGTGAAPVELTLPDDITDPEVRAAVEQAQGRVRTEPRSADAWGELGVTLQANGYGAEAGRYFAEAQRLAPDDGRWPYFRALAALGEDADAALPLLRQAAAGRFPDDAHESAVRLRLAEALLQRQELTEAEELFQKEWQKHPGDPRAALGLGLIAQARGQAAVAEQRLTVAATSPTARKQAAAQLAVLARGRGDAKAAAEREAECAALPAETPVWSDPFYALLQRRRAGANASALNLFQLESQQRYADAAAAYARLIEHQPTPQNYAGAGLNAVRAGQADRGLKLLREAVRIDPQRADSHFALAQALFQIAAAELQRTPQSRAARDQFLEAAAAARRATELKPDNAYAYLLWGHALMNRQEWAAAAAPLRSGVAVRPEAFDLQLALGEALLEAGQLGDAEVHLTNATKLDAKDDRPAAALRRLRQKK